MGDLGVLVMSHTIWYIGGYHFRSTSIDPAYIVTWRRVLVSVFFLLW